MSKTQNNPRILLFGVAGRRIILLHGFKKTGNPNDKIPERDIAIAEKRMKEFLEREGLL
jgi:phage-related protein